MSEIQTCLKDLLPHIQKKLAAGEDIWIKPGGVSMLPMLHPDRDLVKLSPLPTKLKKFDLPLYRRDNGQFVLHRIIQVGETYTCIGDNQYVKETGVRQDQMIALVSAFVRKGREYSVLAPMYRLYCRVWSGTRFVRRGCRSLRYRLGRLRAWMKSKF